MLVGFVVVVDVEVVFVVEAVLDVKGVVGVVDFKRSPNLTHEIGDH